MVGQRNNFDVEQPYMNVDFITLLLINEPLPKSTSNIDVNIIISFGESGRLFGLFVQKMSKHNIKSTLML